MNKQYTIVKSYQNNVMLRKSFNELAMKTFGIDFEDWYQNGYWGEKYIPYSILDGNKVIANVSVHLMEFETDGYRKKYIQLGTVMTEEAYRNQGLIRKLIEEVEKDYAEKAEGFYLFANDSVKEFYPKFGFKEGREYQYSKSVQNNDEASVVQISMKDMENWRLLEDAITSSVNYSCFEMKNNMELIMFYITKFMQENVYYMRKQNAYIIAEIEDETVLLHNIFADRVVDLDNVAQAFGKEIKRMILGFTPLKKDGYKITEVQEEDTTLFLRGTGFINFEKEEKMFPTLSHA